MRAYDFDGTIYAGDSTVDFYAYCLRKHPRLLASLPRNVISAVAFAIGRLSRSEFKSRFLASFLPFVDASAEAEEFWDGHARRMRKWYLDQRDRDDMVLSASPEFLLRPICSRLGVRLVATEVDPSTGMLLGPNMRGEEKVRAYRGLYGDEVPEEFYSDSLSDEPMMLYARRAYLVRRGLPVAWEPTSPTKTRTP